MESNRESMPEDTVPEDEELGDSDAAIDAANSIHIQDKSLSVSQIAECPLHETLSLTTDSRLDQDRSRQ